MRSFVRIRDHIATQKKRTIVHAYRNCGTHAWMLFPTLAQGNSKNKIRQDTEEEGKNRRVNTWKEAQRNRKKKKSRKPNCSSGLPSPPGSQHTLAVDELPTEANRHL